ncbi:hypothetical protein [Salinibacterium sp. ZJ454]|uniref:hypothetical protein n=1 Tax=Salinibacterium sp. ZJ454 TaxID=2708339 RepID=UPI00142194E5|nr:hypothetical protein [Salinibacterium sp. ZJ454]
MNKTATKWLSSSVVAFALAGGSLAVAIPAQAAGTVSQSVATNNDPHRDHDGRNNDRRDHDRRDHDRRDHDRRSDRRTEALCNFLDRYFDNDRDHNDRNDRWSSDTWRFLEHWYDDHCEED